jgi:hypothetical protein
MTRRQELRRKISERRLVEIERRDAELRAELRSLFLPECRRCGREVAPEELSPGRTWCKRCEADRRKFYRDREKAVA